MSHNTNDVPLQVRFEGPGARKGRILLADLVFFGRHLQSAVDRVARALSGDARSARPGKKPRGIQASCALQVVALEPASFQLTLDLARDQMQLEDLDLGVQALERLVAGIEEVAGEHPELPSGYDTGVLESWREAGKLLERGIDQIEFRLQTSRVARVVQYNSQVHARVLARTLEPVQNRRSFEGRLLMADFKETGPRCRLHLPTGESIPCSFDYGKYESVLAGLLQHVRITGEAHVDPRTGEVQNLRIDDLEVLENNQTIDPNPIHSTSSGFWQGLGIDELAQAQKVQPVEHLEVLYGDFWPANENVDDVVREIYQRRRSDRQRGLY